MSKIFRSVRYLFARKIESRLDVEFENVLRCRRLFNLVVTHSDEVFEFEKKRVNKAVFVNLEGFLFCDIEDFGRRDVPRLFVHFRNHIRVLGKEFDGFRRDTSCKRHVHDVFFLNDKFSRVTHDCIEVWQNALDGVNPVYRDVLNETFFCEFET